MAYHSVLATSDDFVSAMLAAHQIAQVITDMLNSPNHHQTLVNGTNHIGSNESNHTSNKINKHHRKYQVFPYSIFYVFYEQYISIWRDATLQLISTLLAVFACTFLLLSFDLYTSLIVTLVIAIIIIDMVGVMVIWNIELNAISLVNLVIVSIPLLNKESCLAPF